MKESTMLWVGVGALVAGYLYYATPKIVESFTEGDVVVKRFDDGTTSLKSPRFDATINKDQSITFRSGSVPELRAFITKMGI